MFKIKLDKFFFKSVKLICIDKKKLKSNLIID